MHSHTHATALFLSVQQGGSYLLELLDTFISGFPLLLIGLLEIIVFVYVYGLTAMSMLGLSGLSHREHEIRFSKTCFATSQKELKATNKKGPIKVVDKTKPISNARVITVITHYRNFF